MFLGGRFGESAATVKAVGELEVVNGYGVVWLVRWSSCYLLLWTFAVKLGSFKRGVGSPGRQILWWGNRGREYIPLWKNKEILSIHSGALGSTANIRV